MDVARLNFSHGNREIHAENAERVREAASRGRPPGGDPPGPPGPKIRIGRDRGRHRRAEARREAGAAVRLQRRRQRASGCRSVWGGLAGAVDPEDVIYLADGAIRLRVKAVREGDGEVETAVEIGGSGGLAPGPEHPGLDPRAARRARGGPRHAALRRVDRGRPGRAVVRAHGRGRDQRAPAHAAAADRQDREAAGGRRGRGDHPRRRLRDGRPRRPGDRAADRGRPDRAEAAAAPSPAASPARRSPPPRCSTRWSPPRARPAPRWPTWPTRSSTAPTR